MQLSEITFVNYVSYFSCRCVTGCMNEFHASQWIGFSGITFLTLEERIKSERFVSDFWTCVVLGLSRKSR